MSRILDIRADWVHEARNHAFSQIVTRDTIQSMYDLAGVDEVFDLYDFKDSFSLVGAGNKGTGGVLGNMAWDHAALQTGLGWYVHPAEGAQGRGMANVAGSGHYGSVISHSGNSVAWFSKATWTFAVKFDTVPFAANSTVCFKGTYPAGLGWWLLGFAAGSTLSFIVNSNAGLDIVASDTLIAGHWHIITVVADLTLGVVADRVKMYQDGRFVASNGTAGSTTLVEDGSALYVLSADALGTEAPTCTLGYQGTFPGLAMSQAQVQSLASEIRGLFQPTVANQPNDIKAPGMWDMPDYEFIAANNEHLCSFQYRPLFTAEGTLLINFTPHDLTNQQELFGLTEEGAANEDELMVQIRGDLVGDPIELHGVIGGGVDLRLQIPFGGAPNVPVQLGISSDGSTVRAVLNGIEQVVTPIVGANTGQWFASYPNVNVVCLGDTRSAAGAYNPFDGYVQSVIGYDRGMSVLEMQQVHSSGFGPGGPRWLPKR